MFVTAQEAADQCGITVEKLEKIAKRKDCPKKMMDKQGNYNPEIVNKLLARIAAYREQAKRYTKQNKQQSQPRRSVKRSQETLEEFTLRFWKTDDLWQEYMTTDMSEDWAKYFIRRALEFGHRTAYPE